jgi:hypothetical protein
MANSGVVWPIAFAVCCAAMVAGPVGVAPASARGDGSKVAAVYKLRIAGVELATFHFGSAITGGVYTLSGHGKLSWGLGMLKYNGNFTSSGRVKGDSVLPATYAYDWKVNRKSGSVRLAYSSSGGGIKSVEIQPPHTPSPEVIPLKPEHLNGVFDPLTALIVMARGMTGEPCNRQIGVFEGKQRFDIVLSPLRTEKIKETKPSGHPVTAHVCRVTYKPVAGHKLNRETQAAIKAEGIEVALRPVPSAGLLVPYRVLLPTPLGSAVLTAQKVDITLPGDRLIALSH